jgi:hypothetical protein
MAVVQQLCLLYKACRAFSTQIHLRHPRVVNGGFPLFHGSEKKINDNQLLPRPSRLMDGQSVVFATNQRWIALVCICRSNDADLEFGFENGRPYIKELWAHAFAIINKPGYIYTVMAEDFESDQRLGMVNHEFVAHSPVDIVVREYIKKSACHSLGNSTDNRFPSAS